MPISKIKTSSITADAASVNLNIDAGTLYLDAANNRVGIGTASPYRQLQVGDYSTSAIMALGSSSASTGTFCFSSSDSAPGRYVGTIGYNHQTNDMIFGVNAVEAVRINSSGNVAIGSTGTSPSNTLHIIKGDSTTTGTVNWHLRLGIATGSAFNSNGSGIYFDAYTNNYGTQPVAAIASGLESGGSGGAATNHSGFIRFYTKTGSVSSGPTEKMRIDSEGNVGIGTQPAGSGSDYKLDLFTQNATNSMRLLNNNVAGTGAGPQIDFSITQTNTQSARLAAIASEFITNWGGALKFFTKTANGNPDTVISEKMRIDASGNVLIGATTTVNGANVMVSVGSGASATPYFSVSNIATSPTSSASTRIDMGFLNGASNYVATGTTLGSLNFMGQGNDYGYGGAAIQGIVTSGGNVSRGSGHSVDLVFNTKASNSTGSREVARLNSSGDLYVSRSVRPGYETQINLSTSGWSANTWYEVAAPGTFSNGTVYLVVIRWDHISGGPYILANAFHWHIVNTNGTGSENTFTPLGSSHTGGGYMSFRSRAGSSASSGLDVQSTAWNNGTLQVRFFPIYNWYQ
jgi:hypothetical protein